MDLIISCFRMIQGFNAAALGINLENHEKFW